MLPDDYKHSRYVTTRSYSLAVQEKSAVSGKNNTFIEVVFCLLPNISLFDISGLLYTLYCGVLQET